MCRLDFEDEGGSLTLVDCAGSERSQDSLYHDKQRIKERGDQRELVCPQKMYTSVARGPTVEGSRRVLEPGQPHARAAAVSRKSALTRVLREAFVSADACLSVVATVSPSATDAEHTVSTLRTVCELAGTSRAGGSGLRPQASDRAQTETWEVSRPGPQRLPVSRHPPSSQTSSALPPFPNKWSSSGLGGVPRDAVPLIASRGSCSQIRFRWATHLAHERAGPVGAALLQDSAKCETHRRQAAHRGRRGCAVLHKRAREQRRRELRG